MERLYHLILVFSLIFNYRVPVFYNSVILTLFLCLPLFLVRRKTAHDFLRVVSNKYIFRIILFTFILLLLFLFSSFLHGTYDYSFPLKFLSQLIIFIVAAVFLSVTYRKQEDKYLYISKLIFSAFILQVFIQLGSLMSNTFFSYVQFFQIRSDKIASVLAQFEGIRGGALSGDLFFSLGVLYGIVFIFYTKYILDKGRITMFDSTALLLFFTGITLSARVGYIGVLLSIVYFLFHQLSIAKKIGSIVKIALIVFLVIILSILILPSNISDRFVNEIAPFAFEFYYTYIESGDIGTSSTNALLDRMFIYPESMKTWLVGDGMYTGLDGFYYKHTDAGYSRIIFYAGILGLSILFFYQCLFLFPEKNQSFAKEKKGYLLTSSIILLYILTVNIKGLALGSSSGVLVLCMLFFFNGPKKTKS